MLIKKTPWLVYSLTDSAYVLDYAPLGYFYYRYLRMCESGVRKVFDVPFRASRIRIHVHDRPSKYRVRFEIVTGEGYYYARIDDCMNAFNALSVNLTNFQPKVIKRLAQRQKYYYAECEYIEKED